MCNVANLLILNQAHPQTILTNYSTQEKANMELKMLIFANSSKGVFMSVEISRTHDLIKEALDFRAARQDMISSNIANADTPFYRPRDISFEEVLRAKKDAIMGADNLKLALANTNASHIPLSDEKNNSKPMLFFRDGHMARNDGNSVDLDVETTEMSKNSIMFNALIQANKKDKLIFMSVIDASSKLQ